MSLHLLRFIILLNIMLHNLINIFSPLLFSQLRSASDYRGYADEDDEPYNWNEFNSGEFFAAALICAVIIVLGLLIRKNAKNVTIKGIGTGVIVLGSLGALAFIGAPIIAAVNIIFQVVVGAAIFFGIIYWVYKEFIENK